MFNFFSDSSRKRRYPNPNRGSSHYQKGGFFGMGSSFPDPGAAAPAGSTVISRIPVRDSITGCRSRIRDMQHHSPVLASAPLVALLCPQARNSVSPAARRWPPLPSVQTVGNRFLREQNSARNAALPQDDDLLPARRMLYR